jgi:hypothetical protein
VKRIWAAVRNRTTAALRKQGVTAAEAEPFPDLIQCEPEQLARHLQRHLTPPMTLATFGKRDSPDGWTIDHIRPLSRYDLTDTFTRFET